MGHLSLTQRMEGEAEFLLRIGQSLLALGMGHALVGKILQDPLVLLETYIGAVFLQGSLQPANHNVLVPSRSDRGHFGVSSRGKRRERGHRERVCVCIERESIEREREY